MHNSLMVNVETNFAQ